MLSRESVRIEFLLKSLNDLEIFTCYKINAYLNAKCRYILCTEACKWFGTEKWMVVIIARSLYGIKSSGVKCRSKSAATLNLFGYKSSGADYV